MTSRIPLFAVVLMVITLTSCGNSTGSKPEEVSTTQNQPGTDRAEAKTLSDNSLSANRPSTRPRVNPDSVELTALIRNVYEWHETKYPNYGFPLKVDTPSDSLFTGIDWAAYNKDYAAFKKTNFFSDEFLAKHRAIAVTIDSSIRRASVEWRNSNDGIPLWYSDSDDWCNCQDNPDNYWQRLTLSNLKLGDNTAVFNWTWDEKDGIEPPFIYEIKAKKVNGTWKISYLEGFQKYGTVASYDERMKPTEQPSTR